jgi:hypothetical protein
LDPPRWNKADLLIQCFPGQGSAQLQYFAFSAMAVLVIVFFTFGWPLFTYLTLKHLFDQHAVTVRLADLPPDEASAIIRSNRPTQAEERCATPQTIGFEKVHVSSTRVIAST